VGAGYAAPGGMPYVDADGVHTWYAEHGSGLPLLLLHGALTDASEFGATIPALAQHFRVVTPEQRGHGHTADVDGPISYDITAQDTIAFIEMLGLGPAHLIGHSDGANVALLVTLARRDHFPAVVAKIGRMFASEPTLTADDLGQVPRRTLVMAGDDDEIRAEHTLALYRSIPDAELAVVPGNLARADHGEAGAVQPRSRPTRKRC
jgi:predicted esterase